MSMKGHYLNATRKNHPHQITEDGVVHLYMGVLLRTQLSVEHAKNRTRKVIPQTQSLLLEIARFLSFFLS